jgi:GAF domain-containing protein
MIPQAKLLDYFVEVTDTLIDDFDLVEFLRNLTTKAATVSGAAAVGLVLTDHQDRVRYMASSNEDGKMLELFQIQNDDGPCLDAITSGQPVVNADLGDAGDRWPKFAPAARAAGFQSVHAFPMRVRNQIIGALNIFGNDKARFDPDDVRVVQALADVATIAIIQERIRHEAELITDQLQNALHSRIIIEQAKGALARAQGISTSKAFDVMRTTARSTRRRLHDIAGAIVDDLDESESRSGSAAPHGYS